MQDDGFANAAYEVLKTHSITANFAVGTPAAATPLSW
jgi:hypothetical protein